jgi:hypothetical protein
MPPPQLAPLAKKAGVSPAEAEKAWDKAKKQAKGAKLKDGSTIPDSEEKWSGKHYAYVVGILKKMLGMKEDTMNDIAIGRILPPAGTNLPEDEAEQLVVQYLAEGPTTKKAVHRGSVLERRYYKAMDQVSSAMLELSVIANVLVSQGSADLGDEILSHQDVLDKTLTQLRLIGKRVNIAGRGRYG